MAWNYTAYILWKYSIRRGENIINFRNFMNFIFVELGMKHRLFFHDGERDLCRDLEYLKDLGAIELVRNDKSITKIIVKELLGEIAKAVEDFPRKIKTRLFEEYLKRIDSAIDVSLGT